MCEVGLEAKVRQRRPYVSYNGTISHIADNRLDRNFTPDKPNTTFVSDVTEFRVAGRKVYLTPVMDLCDRSIVAHAVATSPSTAFYRWVPAIGHRGLCAGACVDEAHRSRFPVPAFVLAQPNS